MDNKILKKHIMLAIAFGELIFLLKKYKGVISGNFRLYGRSYNNPSYEIVCSGFSGHLEVVEVTYDENIVSFEELTKLFFFEIHDFTQTNGQGPDIGSQYLKVILCG